MVPNFIVTNIQNGKFYGMHILILLKKVFNITTKN